MHPVFDSGIEPIFNGGSMLSSFTLSVCHNAFSA